MIVSLAVAFALPIIAGPEPVLTGTSTEGQAWFHERWSSVACRFGRSQAQISCYRFVDAPKEVFVLAPRQAEKPIVRPNMRDPGHRLDSCIASLNTPDAPWRTSSVDEIVAVSPDTGEVYGPCPTGAGAGAHARKPKLSRAQAAALAATIANDRCAHTYGIRPFAAEDWPIVQEGGRENRWAWGRLDVLGPQGYSATVSFGPGGEAARVQVYKRVDERREIFKFEEE